MRFEGFISRLVTMICQFYNSFTRAKITLTKKRVEKWNQSFLHMHSMRPVEAFSTICHVEFGLSKYLYYLNYKNTMTMMSNVTHMTWEDFYASNKNLDLFEALLVRIFLCHFYNKFCQFKINKSKKISAKPLPRFNIFKWKVLWKYQRQQQRW